MPGNRWKIGELAQRSGAAVETIRYYEKAGLLAPPARTAGNYRLYGDADLERLRFILRCRALDMRPADVARLLAVRATPEASCGAVNALLDAHISDIGQRLADLQALQTQLTALRGQCHAVQAAQDCAILRGLETPRRSAS